MEGELTEVNASIPPATPPASRDTMGGVLASYTASQFEQHSRCDGIDLH